VTIATNLELLRFSGPDELARAAAREWLAMLGVLHRDTSCPQLSRPAAVALSGGRIYKQFFNAVVELTREAKADFAGVDFFWADERCVPPNDPESNYRVARELLFEPLRIPAPQIRRIHGEEEPEKAAYNASRDLRSTVQKKSAEWPVLDLVFLGMGEDGHVASLFPGVPPPSLDWRPYYPVVDAPKPPPQRVTLTYDAIAAAENVWVLVSGSGKEAALQESLAGGATPLAKVLKMRKKTRIFFDLSL
jgi:6-phosphogluconolactonase